MSTAENSLKHKSSQATPLTTGAEQKPIQQCEQSKRAEVRTYLKQILGREPKEHEVNLGLAQLMLLGEI